MTAADGVGGFCLRGFIPLFVFRQNCFRSQIGEVRAGSGRRSTCFVRKVFLLLDVRKLGRLVGLANGSLEDSRTDSGLAEPQHLLKLFLRGVLAVERKCP